MRIDFDLLVYDDDDDDDYVRRWLWPVESVSVTMTDTNILSIEIDISGLLLQCTGSYLTNSTCSSACKTAKSKWNYTIDDDDMGTAATATTTTTKLYFAFSH